MLAHERGEDLNKSLSVNNSTPCPSRSVDADSAEAVYRDTLCLCARDHNVTNKERCWSYLRSRELASSSLRMRSPREPTEEQLLTDKRASAGQFQAAHQEQKDGDQVLVVTPTDQRSHRHEADALHQAGRLRELPFLFPADVQATSWRRSSICQEALAAYDNDECDDDCSSRSSTSFSSVMGNTSETDWEVASEGHSVSWPLDCETENDPSWAVPTASAPFDSHVSMEVISGGFECASPSQEAVTLSQHVHMDRESSVSLRAPLQTQFSLNVDGLASLSLPAEGVASSKAKDRSEVGGFSKTRRDEVMAISPRLNSTEYIVPGGYWAPIPQLELQATSSQTVDGKRGITPVEQVSHCVPLSRLMEYNDSEEKNTNITSRSLFKNCRNQKGSVLSQQRAVEEHSQPFRHRVHASTCQHCLSWNTSNEVGNHIPLDGNLNTPVTVEMSQGSGRLENCQGVFWSPPAIPVRETILHTHAPPEMSPARKVISCSTVPNPVFFQQAFRLGTQQEGKRVSPCMMTVDQHVQYGHHGTIFNARSNGIETEDILSFPCSHVMTGREHLTGGSQESRSCVIGFDRESFSVGFDPNRNSRLREIQQRGVFSTDAYIPCSYEHTAHIHSPQMQPSAVRSGNALRTNAHSIDGVHQQCRRQSLFTQTTCAEKSSVQKIEKCSVCLSRCQQGRISRLNENSWVLERDGMATPVNTCTLRGKSTLHRLKRCQGSKICCEVGRKTDLSLSHEACGSRWRCSCGTAQEGDGMSGLTVNDIVYMNACGRRVMSKMRNHSNNTGANSAAKGRNGGNSRDDLRRSSLARRVQHSRAASGHLPQGQSCAGQRASGSSRPVVRYAHAGATKQPKPTNTREYIGPFSGFGSSPPTGNEESTTADMSTGLENSAKTGRPPPNISPTLQSPERATSFHSIPYEVGSRSGDEDASSAGSSTTLSSGHVNKRSRQARLYQKAGQILRCICLVKAREEIFFRAALRLQRRRLAMQEHHSSVLVKAKQQQNHSRDNLKASPTRAYYKAHRLEEARTRSRGTRLRRNIAESRERRSFSVRQSARHDTREAVKSSSISRTDNERCPAGEQMNGQCRTASAQSPQTQQQVEPGPQAGPSGVPPAVRSRLIQRQKRDVERSSLSSASVSSASRVNGGLRVQHSQDKDVEDDDEDDDYDSDDDSFSSRTASAFDEGEENKQNKKSSGSRKRRSAGDSGSDSTDDASEDVTKCGFFRQQ